MATLPTYPFTIWQKADLFLFAREEEKANIEKLNRLNQELHDLNSEIYHSPYGRPVPYGFIDRFTTSRTNNTTFESEFKAINKQIDFIKEKKALEVIVRDPKKWEAHKLKERIKNNPPNQDHIEILHQQWKNQIIKNKPIKAGTVLYSGQSSIDEMVFNQMANHNGRGQGMWLTQDIDDAVTYAYKTGLGKTGSQIFKFIVEHDFNVVELNPHYHPGLLDANADRQNLPLASHETITYGFNDIITPFVEQGIISPEAIGHLRYDPFKPKEISELWVNKPDPAMLKADDIFILPLNRDEFEKSFPRNSFTKFGENKALQQLSGFSGIGDMEAWTALSFKADKIQKGDYQDLTTLIKECGFSQVTPHIQTVIEHSKQEALIDLLVKHHMQLSQSHTQTQSAPSNQPSNQLEINNTPKPKR